MNNLNQATAQAIRAQSDALADAIVVRQYASQPQIWAKFGPNGREKSIRDAAYHLAYLSEAIAHEAPILFTDYISWIKVLFDNLKFPSDTVAKTLEATQFVIHQQLVPEMVALVDDYLTAGFTCLSDEPKSPPVFIHESLPLGGLARKYLEALLRGDRQEAKRLILDSSTKGVNIKDLYLHVFQRSQYEIGRLWQTNQINVAQEHFCSFSTQLIMSEFSAQIYSTERVNLRMLATCIGDELHDMGMRMVTDFFEMAGWNTYYLGANTPSDSILQALREKHTDLLAISVTISHRLNEAASLIAKVHADETLQHVKILVGGYPFNISENLWKTINADGYGRDAQQALEVANKLAGL